MSNFDLAIGLSASEINRYLSEYYNVASDGDSLFKGSEEIEEMGLTLVFEWHVTQAPEFVFGTPVDSAWAIALGKDGQTNEEANRPVPSDPMLQLTIPVIDVKWGIKDTELQSGTTHNVIAYATLDFSNSAIKITLVALRIDQSEFQDIDKQIFNLLVLPVIFDTAEQALAVIKLPEIDLRGLEFNPLQVILKEKYLLGAATLKSNQSPLDITSLTIAQDPAFILLSRDVFNSALTAAFASNGEFIKEETGVFNSLADWSYTVKALPSLALDTVSPLVIKGTADMSVDAELTLTDEALFMLTPQGCAFALWGYF